MGKCEETMRKLGLYFCEIVCLDIFLFKADFGGHKKSDVALASGFDFFLEYDISCAELTHV